METCRWDYRVVVYKKYNVSAFEARLNDFGVAGCELVTRSTTVKTWLNLTGSDLVAVLKRPSEEVADRSHVPAFSMEGEWHPDPVGRHERRWWMARNAPSMSTTARA
ncbi:MAG: hypothetical protein ACRDV7_12845 [Acidimicrobiia bacterium]